MRPKLLIIFQQDSESKSRFSQVKQASQTGLGEQYREVKALRALVARLEQVERLRQIVPAIGVV
jgi:hypothetical protein